MFVNNLDDFYGVKTVSHLSQNLWKVCAIRTSIGKSSGVPSAPSWSTPLGEATAWFRTGTVF